MGEIVNLRQYRRRQAREDAAVAAKQNRVLHGRTAAQKQAEAIAARRHDQALDGARVAPQPAARDDEPACLGSASDYFTL